MTDSDLSPLATKVAEVAKAFYAEAGIEHHNTTFFEKGYYSGRGTPSAYRIIGALIEHELLVESLPPHAKQSFDNYRDSQVEALLGELRSDTKHRDEAALGNNLRIACKKAAAELRSELIGNDKGREELSRH